MWKDPIVEDVRKVRKQLEIKSGPDQDAFLKHIYDQEKMTKARLVSRSPKKRLAHKAA
jgi:hypothetical protein